jgi:DNA-binding MarR family transcriptional regulator
VEQFHRSDTRSERLHDCNEWRIMHGMATPRGSAPQDDAPLSGDVDAVLRTCRALVGIAAKSLAAVEDAVTVPQLRVLMMVATRGPLNLAAVAAGLDVNPSSASRICERLVKAELLNRAAAPQDRRNVVLTLTPSGRRLVGKVDRHRRTSIERVLRPMAVGDRRATVQAFELFATAAGEPDGAAERNLLWPPSPR